MPQPVLCTLKRNPPGTELSEWELHVAPPATDGEDPEWEATIHDSGVFMEIPAAGVFLQLRWEDLLQVTWQQGTHWDDPIPYALTEAGRAAVSQSLKGDDDEPATTQVR